MPPVPKNQSINHIHTVSLPVHQNGMWSYIVKISRTTYWLLEHYWNLAKSYHCVDQEPDHCTLHDCGTFFVVVGFQAFFHDFARWHVLELEQESPEHGLHCPHAHTNTATLCQFMYWRGHKTKVLTMWRSVHVELSTCHKVHLSPQISLSCNSIPRQQNLSEYWPFSRTVHGRLFPPTSRGNVGAVPLSCVPCQPLWLWAPWACCSEKSIGHHWARLGLYVLGPQSLSQRRALHALPVLEFCGPTYLLTSIAIHSLARLPSPMIWSAIHLCCQPGQCFIYINNLHSPPWHHCEAASREGPHEVRSHKFSPPRMINEICGLNPAHCPDALQSRRQQSNSLASWHQHHACNLCPGLAQLFIWMI